MTTEQVLEKYGKIISKGIQDSLRRNDRAVTGSTIRSIRYNVSANSVTVHGAKHIDTIIIN